MFQPQKPAGGTAPGVEEGRKLLGGRYLMKNNINYFLPSVNLTLAYILLFKKKNKKRPNRLRPVYDLSFSLENDNRDIAINQEF